METWRKELCHHGILGQKWGVRRFQNYDGSYTRRGLEHYGRTKDSYETVKTIRKAIKRATKRGEKSIKLRDEDGREATLNIINPKRTLKAAKQREKEAKVAMNKNYEQLKKDYKADQGKDLYRSGHTITNNKNTISTMAAFTALASYASYKLLQDKGDTYVKGLGRVPTNTLVAASIAAGGAFITGISGAKIASDNSKLRAYYTHSAKYAD